MHNWFLTKIRYEKVMENGIQKKVTEPYLVDALSFTEAEARITEEMTPFISGEFTVSDISRAHYSEIFTSEEDSADKWYAGRLAFITVDEVSGKEKRTYTNSGTSRRYSRRNEETRRRYERNDGGLFFDFVERNGDCRCLPIWSKGGRK